MQSLQICNNKKRIIQIREEKGDTEVKKWLIAAVFEINRPMS